MPFFTKKRIYKKIISLGLCAVLIYNTVIPAFAQEFFYTENPGAILDKTNFEHTAADMEAFLMNYAIEEHNRKMQNDAYARAEEIKKAIMGDVQEELRKEYFEHGNLEQEKEEPSYADKYLQEVQNQVNDAKEMLSSEYKKILAEIQNNEKIYLAEKYFTKEEIANWKTNELARQKRQYQEHLEKIDLLYQQEIDKVNNNYDELLQELKEGADESFYEYVKGLFNELMDLYKKDPDKVREQVLELTPVITALTNKNKEHIYNKEQKQMLLNFYRAVIEEENAKLGTGNRVIHNACETRGYCPELLSSIMGLSVLSPSSQGKYDGTIIFNTIQKFKDTAANFSVLLNGISGLLVMKQYDLVREILINHTAEEHGFSWSKFWDNLNFMSIPLAFANINGKYLGSSSKAGAYWNDDEEYQNIYMDLAFILAEDGSKESLDMLREFGVNRCLVRPSEGVQRETLSKYTIYCGGIKPFLLGALLSGKSGANKYKLPKPAYQPSQYFGKDGKIYDNVPYIREIDNINALENAYYNYAREEFNSDTEAMLAFYIMSEGMGDLNDKEEYALDTMLYNSFRDRIPEKFLKSKYIVIDDARLVQKENRRMTTGVFTGIAGIFDVWFAIYCFWDIALLGGKTILFGKGLFNAFKVAKLSLSFKSIPALARIAANYTKTVFMRQKIVVKISDFAKSLKKVPGEYRGSVRISTLKNAAQYTNAIHERAKLSLSFVRRGGDITPNLTGVTRQIFFNEETGTFFVRANAGQGTLKLSKQVVVAVEDILDAATVRTNSKYRVARMIGKKPQYSTIFLQELEQSVAGSAFGLKDKQTLIGFFRSADFAKPLAKADAHVASLAAKTTRSFLESPLILPVFLNIGEKSKERVGVDFVIGEKIPAFAKDIPKYASVVEGDGRLVVKFLKSESEAIDLSAFKLGFESSESFVDFARNFSALGDMGKIELKFIPQKSNNFWSMSFRNFFARSKEKLFAGRGTVAILSADGKMTETGITLRTYKKYDGLRLIINEIKKGAIEVYKGIDALPIATEGAFFLPKYQLGNMLNFARTRGIESPWKIKLIGGKNKVNALYWQALISLGVAVSGLVGPLSKNYPDIDTKTLNLICMILPYAFSFATPFVAPLVKKFGAVNILKTSMYLSAASLTLPIFAGFHGLGGIQADNPFDKPSPSSLYPSAILIGIASTLMRGSASPLVQAVGGGTVAMKMKAFKSISSFMLILPPLIGAGIDYINPKYFTNSDGSLYLNENGLPVQKHWFDFSFSYPVMLAIAGVALYKVQRAHFDVNIGRAANGGFKTFRQFMQDGFTSYRTLIRREMLPLTLGSMFINGAESSLLYNYSNSVANEYVGNRVHTEALIPVLALLILNSPAFVSRMKSKPILKALGGDNMLGYRNIITVSLALTGAGSYFLAKQDDPVSFAAGLTLVSLGFSQITASILRYGHHKLGLELKVPKHIVTSWDVSYPTIYLGMSIVPYLYGYMVDRNIEGLEVGQEYKRSLKNASMREMIALPIASLLLGSGFTYLGMRPKTALKTINSGGLIGPLGLIFESHNSYFKTLALPIPKPVFNRSMFTQPKFNVLKPDFQHNKNLDIPFNLGITPRFTLQPVR